MVEVCLHNTFNTHHPLPPASIGTNTCKMIRGGGGRSVLTIRLCDTQLFNYFILETCFVSTLTLPPTSPLPALLPLTHTHTHTPQ